MLPDERIHPSPQNREAGTGNILIGQTFLFYVCEFKYGMDLNVRFLNMLVIY